MMELREIVIEALPGIEPGFTLSELGPGINFVHGPNGIGKSSLVRALEAALYPHPQRDRATRVRVTFAGDPAQVSSGDGGTKSGSLTAENLNGAGAWSAQGVTVSPPVLPPAAQLGCYTLSLETLLEQGQNEAAFQTLVSRELSGGYDLDALASAPQFVVRPQAGKAEQQRLADAEQTLRTQQGEHVRLAQEQASIGRLERELDDARSARGLLNAIDAARALGQQQGELADCEAELADLPAELERIQPDDLVNARQTAKEFAAAERAVTRGEEVLELSRQRKAQLGTGSRPAGPETSEDSSGCASVTGSTLSRLEQRIGELQHVESELRELTNRRERTRVQEQVSRAGLGTHEPAAPPLLSVDELEAVREAVDEMQRLRGEHDRLQGQLGPADPAAPSSAVSADPFVYQQGRALLLKWLRLNEEGESRRLADGLLLATLVAALIGAGLAVAAGQAWAIVLAVPAVALALTRFQSYQKTGKARAAIEAEFGALEITSPDSWTSAAVEARLKALDEDVQFAANAAREAQRRQDLERALASKREQLAEATASFEALRQQVHPDVDAPPAAAGFERWLALSAQLEQAAIEHEAIEAASVRLRTRQAQLLEELEATLEPHRATGEPAPVDAADCRRELNALRDALEAEQEAARALTAAATDLERARAELTRTGDQLRAIFERAGLRVGDEDALAEKLDSRERRMKATARLRTCEGALAQAQRAFEEALTRVPLPKMRAELTAATAEELDRLARIHEAQAARERELTERIAQIEARVQRAKADRALEAARANRDAAKEALEEKYEEALLATAGRGILEAVSEEHNVRHEPELLSRASNWLQRFTNHRYQLSFRSAGLASLGTGASSTGAPEQQGIMAFDTRTERFQPPDALSTGTRMQLLIAARLAFAEHLEQNAQPLPLFLDEALGTSDPARYEAVVQAVSQIVADQSRQVVYLTAQPHELAYWQAQGPVNALDLASVRGMATPDAPGPAPEPVELQPAIDVAELSPAALLDALQVTALDPFAPSGSAHAYHLLRDQPALLGRLWNLQLKDLGAIRALLSAKVGQDLLDENERALLTWRVLGLEAWRDAWLEGRGRPLRPGMLANCKAVSNAFRPRFDEILEEGNAQAKHLITTIQERSHPAVRGFRKDKLEDLIAWLSDEEFLDPRPVLAPEAIFLRMLESLREAIRDAALSPEAVRSYAQQLFDGLRVGRPEHSGETARTPTE